MVQKSWISTISFRRFRETQSVLSKVYWTHKLGEELIAKQASLMKPDEFVADVLSLSVKRGMFSLKAADAPQWMAEYINSSRLYILVYSLANLEAYLKGITYVYLLSEGYGDVVRDKLTAIGEAIGAPILNRSSLPKPLRYAENLFGVRFGHDLPVLDQAYAIRCAAAHVGHRVTPRLIKQNPWLKMKVGESLNVGWDDLRSYLRSADRIAVEIDSNVVSRDIHEVEVEIELAQLKADKKLPAKKELWKFAHDEWGVMGMSVPFRKRIEAQFY